jgi:hypothetical protein
VGLCECGEQWAVRVDASFSELRDWARQHCASTLQARFILRWNLGTKIRTKMPTKNT